MKTYISVTRSDKNPILKPDPTHPWEKDAVFNGSVWQDHDKVHIVYRAIGLDAQGKTRSTIGYAESRDGINFSGRRQFIVPQFDWEKYGCEDPRMVKIDNTYYIFYTAISTDPASPAGIKVALAITHDLRKIEEKHPVTPFNAKAMSLFPGKINGKYYAVVTINTDYPPAKIGIISFDRIEQIWDANYWNEWYANRHKYILPLRREETDQIEIGSAPVKTKDGWLLIYSYIKNYMSNKKIFTAEALLLDESDPLKIKSVIHQPLLLPEEQYELNGIAPNIIFPSAAIVKKDELYFYYGAADTSIALATMPLNDLLTALSQRNDCDLPTDGVKISLIRYDGNPLLNPIKEHKFEEKSAYNPSTLLLGNRVYMVYRAQDNENKSSVGFVLLKDGYHIEKRLDIPIYFPRESFEKPTGDSGSGCEDPRLTQIADRIYMLYTAYNGVTPRVAMTSISVEDFRNERWNWETSKLITVPNIMDKDAAVLPEKVNGKYVFFHRIEPDVWIDYADTLDFPPDKFISGTKLFSPRQKHWDDVKVGLSGTPIKTEIGWLVIYHGISSLDDKYRLGIILLKLDDPSHVLLRLDEPILEPIAEYEDRGLRSGTVFSNGAVVLENVLYVYYGGADQNTCVARISYPYLISKLKSLIPSQSYQQVYVDELAPVINLNPDSFKL